MKDIFNNLKEKIEQILPMTVGSFFLFLIVAYAFFIVGRMMVINYNSNKELEKEAVKVEEMAVEIDYMKDQINYLQTNSFKEKEARAKLAYKGVGEGVIALPVDKIEEKTEDRVLSEKEVKVPNQKLWWRYYFESK